MEFNNLDDLFRDLDDAKATVIPSDSLPVYLGKFKTQLVANGFTNREAMRLVVEHTRFIYDISAVQCQRGELD